MKKVFFNIALALSTITPVMTFAQESAPNAKPVTNEELNTYIGMGGVVSCDLMVYQKVPFSKALPAASTMVTNVIVSKHGGKFASNPKQEAIPTEQIFQISFANIVNLDKNICYGKLTQPDQAEVDKTVEAFKKAQSSGK